MEKVVSESKSPPPPPPKISSVLQSLDFQLSLGPCGPFTIPSEFLLYRRGFYKIPWTTVAWILRTRWYRSSGLLGWYVPHTTQSKSLLYRYYIRCFIKFYKLNCGHLAFADMARTQSRSNTFFRDTIPGVSSNPMQNCGLNPVDKAMSQGGPWATWPWPVWAIYNTDQVIYRCYIRGFKKSMHSCGLNPADNEIPKVARWPTWPRSIWPIYNPVRVLGI